MSKFKISVQRKEDYITIDDEPLVSKSKDTVTSRTDESTLTVKYKKMKHREHILSRAETYVGRRMLDELEMYIYEENKMVWRMVKIVPALIKLIDEGLVNMSDHVMRVKDQIHKQQLLKDGKTMTDETINLDDKHREVKRIRMTVDVENNTITMENDGDGIDVAMHPEEQVYIPQMIFFEILSGTNFDDDQERTWGGRNGYGAKLIAVFSTEFQIETVDAKRGLKYQQTTRQNMSIIDPPVVTKCRTLPYTKITFKPDLAYFGLKSLADHDHVAVMEKRLVDIAGTTGKDVVVYFNDKKIVHNTFEKYIDLYIGGKKDAKRVALVSNPRWEVYAANSPNGKFEHVSFVNGIYTPRAGKHVDHVSTIVSGQLADSLKDSKKSLKDLKPAMVKNCLWLFINSTIVSPQFDNQMKECLTTPSKSFGSKFEITEDELSKLTKIGIAESCLQLLDEKNHKDAKKTDGTRATRVNDDKLRDAKYVAGSKALECTLILTEGDSAKALALGGMAALDQDARNRIGLMPLKGKLINVRKGGDARTNANQEFARIKAAMGLKQGQHDVTKLRYGHIAVMADADHDGYHIKALLFNIFRVFWPELLKLPGFFLSLRTPIVGIWKKTDLKKQGKYFYSYVEFEEWQQATSEAELKTYDFKYYKGLATHSAMEGRDIFRNIQFVDYKWQNDLSYNWISIEDKDAVDIVMDETEAEDAVAKALVVGITGGAAGDSTNNDEEDDTTDSPRSGTTEVSGNDSTMVKRKPVEQLFAEAKDYCETSFQLAFDNGFEDYRKDWLYKFLISMSQKRVDFSFQKGHTINYHDFINSELIQFSVADCNRSIANLIDGFKPSQRKIMYCCLKRKLYKDIKVEQLGGNISEKTNYHHGTASLYEAIILMAQDYVGSNNINLLVPNGGFGTRNENGGDHGAPRYIFTHLNTIVKYLFDVRDFPLLEYTYDEGKYYEPYFYVPLLPLVLINGSRGIGTGWSTDVPSYNVEDIIQNIERKFRGEEMVEMTPFYRGYQGTIVPVTPSRYKVTGVYEKRADQVIVTEIPVGTKSAKSFESYKSYLYKLWDTSPTMIRHVEFDSDDVSLRVVISFQPEQLEKLTEENLEKLLKLSSFISTKNMNLYTPERILKHYNSTIEILDSFIQYRIQFYEKRKKHILEQLERQCRQLSEKVRYILMEIDDTNSFTVRKKKKTEVVKLLVDHNFLRFPKAKTVGGEDDDQDEDATVALEAAARIESTDSADGDYSDFNYLVKMPIVNQTYEMVEKLKEDQRQKETEMAELAKLTAVDLYTVDLTEFKKAYAIFMDKWKAKEYANLDDKQTGSGKKTAGRAKRPPKKTR